jgi:hypothetical protein
VAKYKKVQAEHFSTPLDSFSLLPLLSDFSRLSLGAQIVSVPAGYTAGKSNL